MRLFLYIMAWVVINVGLSMLWAFIDTGPGLAFLLGMLHGGISQVWLFGKYTRAF